MPTRSPLILLSLWAIAAPALLAQKDFPIVPEDFQVSLFARDPIVRNPCAITFDAKGRLCVGMGPQYRSPKPDTKPDSVWIITDEDSDWKTEKRHQFTIQNGLYRIFSSGNSPLIPPSMGISSLFPGLAS